MRKPLMILAIVGLLVLAVIGALLPFLQGWIFLVIALFLLVTEFDSGRAWVKRARQRWPGLSARIRQARGHRWATRHLAEFDDHTDPTK